MIKATLHINRYELKGYDLTINFNSSTECYKTLHQFLTNENDDWFIGAINGDDRLKQVIINTYTGLLGGYKCDLFTLKHIK